MTPYGTEYTMRLIIYTFLERKALQNNVRMDITTAGTKASMVNFKINFYFY
jgi:hypothetical protein